MNSSSGLGWPDAGIAGAGLGFVPVPPPSCCFCCSFCSRRSFRISLALRQGGLLGSAPTPESTGIRTEKISFFLWNDYFCFWYHWYIKLRVVKMTMNLLHYLMCVIEVTGQYSTPINCVVIKLKTHSCCSCSVYRHREKEAMFNVLMWINSIESWGYSILFNVNV